MNLQQFSAQVDLVSKTEVQKVAYLSFFHLKQTEEPDFSLDQVEGWFALLHFASPNASRLKTKLLGSGICVVAPDRAKLRLHAKTIARLQLELPEISKDSEEIVAAGSILPQTLTKSTRGYIER